MKDLFVSTFGNNYAHFDSSTNCKENLMHIAKMSFCVKSENVLGADMGSPDITKNAKCAIQEKMDVFTNDELHKIAKKSPRKKHMALVFNGNEHAITLQCLLWILKK